ncbi:rhomboid-related intramembrane serine protease family protein [Artemisia annua]|uniref:Rhomboid-related intramembrane serine protease family protein n=1 Tax=Artemisia annua TaxID=35608 RepID=A0A2U1PWI2_ARTAN|nr:rhomboid-related intramembrane serine protease family protein [Artemisia annua]
MAGPPICFKMCYKDPTVNPRVKDMYVCSVANSMATNKAMIKCEIDLRSIFSHESERHKPSRFILRCSREKQLRSLDSCLGKSKDEASTKSSNNDLVSSATSEEISQPTQYLVKNELSKADDHIGSKSDYEDETSGLYIISTMVSINIAVFLFEIASPIKNSELELFSLPALYGAKINHLILYGEWWRLLTPMFLHTGILHIGLGCWALLTFGPQVCRAYGPFTFFLIYVLGGLSGNLTSFLHTPDPTVGGTGPVFAIIGAWLIYHYQNKDAMGKDVFESMYKKAVGATALGFVLSTFGPIDDWMHFGSAFTGIAYGFFTCPTLQIDDSSSETGKENGITLIRRNIDPRKSLVWMEVGKIGRGLMMPMMIANFVVYIIVVGLAAWSIDKYIDGQQDHPHLGGNPSTTYMLEFGLLGGATGLCSLVIGFMHLRAWRSASLASASSSAFISWAITTVAFGFAWKEIKMGGRRGKRLQTLELFITISAISQLLYLMLLHAGVFSKKYGPDYLTHRDDIVVHRVPAQSQPSTSSLE